MNFKYLLFSFVFLLLSFTPNRVSVKNLSPIEFTSMNSLDKMIFIDDLYNDLMVNESNLPKKVSFEKGLLGFYELKKNGKINKNILTIVDFSLPSTKKRLWVIDLNQNKILYNTLVAHGVKSGSVYAKSFSNKIESNKSSLGFYATGESYVGKHGLSLKLDGLEKGINNNARKRDIVIHGAAYVSKAYAKGNQTGLGRSLGCPALPQKLSKTIISKIKNKTCLFIYAPDKTYAIKSKLIS